MASTVYTYNGLTTDDLTVVCVGQEGLDELPDIRSGDNGMPRRDGLLAGIDLLGGRTITLDLALSGTPAVPIPALLDQVKKAFAPVRSGSRPLTFQWPGISLRVANCRPRKFTSALNGDLTNGVAVASVQLVADDPLIYDQSVQSLSTGLPTPSSGTTFPATFPLTFGGTTGGGGQIVAANTGTTATSPTVTITGPVTNPRIENQATGETMALTISLGPSDSLALDFSAHTVTLNGSGDRYAAVVPGSAWFALAPGSTTVAFFSSDASPTGSTMTVQFQSAWL